MALYTVGPHCTQLSQHRGSTRAKRPKFGLALFRTAHPGRALVAAVRPQSRPSQPQALHHLVTAAALMARTTRSSKEEGRAIESAARVDGEAALSQRPPTALHHASAADRHHSVLNSCRLAGRTAAAQRMTMRSFVLPPSRWRGWAGPYWGPWAAKGHASRTLAAHSPHTGASRPSGKLYNLREIERGLKVGL